MRRFRDRQSNRLFRGGEAGPDAVDDRHAAGPGDDHPQSTRRRYLAVSGRRSGRCPPIKRTSRRAPAGQTPTLPAATQRAAAVALTLAKLLRPTPRRPTTLLRSTPRRVWTRIPEERAAIADEFQAITDRRPIAKEDMFAYWRLLRWTESAKLPALLRRARTDVRYGDLILDPAGHRGELMKVRLHVVQVLKHRATADNPLGIETYYQAVGWNDSSQAWFYFCIFTDLPPGMPLGDRITQEGTFVGYFLKTITVPGRSGKGEPGTGAHRADGVASQSPSHAARGGVAPAVAGSAVCCWLGSRRG